MDGHEFQIVLMRADPKVGDAPKRFLRGLGVWNEDTSFWIVEFHISVLLTNFWKTGRRDGLAVPFILFVGRS